MNVKGLNLILLSFTSQIFAVQEATKCLCMDGSPDLPPLTDDLLKVSHCSM